MNTRRNTFAVALLALVAGTAFAQEGKSREQVRAEFEQARRNGDLLVTGEIGQPENQLHPARYPAQAAASKSREEVRAELAQAQREGDVIAGESGLALNQLYPARYPGHTMVASRSRAEVKAEVIEARRNGDLMAAGELGLTQREQFQRARTTTSAARHAQDTATVAQPSLPAPITATR